MLNLVSVLIADFLDILYFREFGATKTMCGIVCIVYVSVSGSEKLIPDSVHCRMRGVKTNRILQNAYQIKSLQCYAVGLYVFKQKSSTTQSSFVVQ